MRIGLYGMPAAGKSYLLDQVDFIEVKQGSRMLREICCDFDSKDDEVKRTIRRKLAKLLSSEDAFIMDGHYSFGDKIAFTESDGQLYDAFLYLYVSPEVLKKRMETSERNSKYLVYDIAEWQESEIESLRKYCHNNDKDFYIIDNPPENFFGDVTEVLEFIKAVANGYSCLGFAKKCSDEILKKTDSDTVVLMDGDKTITIEDSSYAVFGYSTHVYDGNFYTGYQSWRQDKEFKTYNIDALSEMPVALNEAVCEAFTDNTYILTSGHKRVWGYISQRLNIPFYQGVEMAAETKLFITKFLQYAGKKVIAYGDGMNDYYMLKQANTGYLVTKKDGTISRSLKARNLEGLILV